MSRFDYKDPGTDPAYCDPLRAEDDIDVPDFDAPDIKLDAWGIPEGVSVTQEQFNRVLNGALDCVNPPVDPAEHAAHALIDALTTLEQQISLCSDTNLERAHVLRGMALRHEQDAATVTNLASAKVDAITERLR